MSPTVGWGGRTEGPMPEIAEALGVTTDLVMAVHDMGRGKYTAFYSPEYDKGDTTLWLALLKRSGDGILKVVHREPRPDMWERIQAQIEGSLREKFGPPE